MNRIQTSQQALSIARTVTQNNEVLATATDFEVLKLPQGELGHLVLLLFKSGKDFSKAEMPQDVLIPVELDGRKGYLWAQEAALQFAASKS